MPMLSIECTKVRGFLSRRNYLSWSNFFWMISWNVVGWRKEDAEARNGREKGKKRRAGGKLRAGVSLCFSQMSTKPVPIWT
jgi:hypothetical protein